MSSFRIAVLSQVFSSVFITEARCQGECTVDYSCQMTQRGTAGSWVVNLSCFLFFIIVVTVCDWQGNAQLQGRGVFMDCVHVMMKEAH